jgi:hypothetical protein
MNQPSTTGFLDRVKSKINVDDWAQRFNITPTSFVRGSLAFGIGFMSAWILKRHAQSLIATVVATAIVVGLLWYSGALTLDLAVIGSWIDYQGSPTLENILSAYIMWLRSHWGLAACYAVGLLIGYKCT